MKDRCERPTAPGFEYYGGRGIRICEQWKLFDNFLADMGPRPSLKHTLDRIDSDGNYEPSNCRWATSAEQAMNKSNTAILEYQGRTLTVMDWASETGLPYSTIYGRMKLGWTAEQIFTLPKRFMNHNSARITIREETLSPYHWARRFNIHLSTFKRRLENGWTPEEIIRIPRNQKPIK